MSRVSGPTTDGKKKYRSNDKIASSLASSQGTKPRAIFASVGEYLAPDGGSSATSQYFATRVRSRIAGGKWLALAPVFVGAYLASLRSPTGTNTHGKATISFALELANGSQQAAYASTNAGGTLLTGTFNGSRDTVLSAGDLVVGDWIYASDAGLTYFEWTDRTLLPWIRVAYSKSNANDVLGAVTQTEYNYPSNSHLAVCSSYAAAKGLIDTVGISNYNGGTDAWGAGDSQSLPSCIGFIGIPADGQQAVICFGTSILDGDGDPGNMQSGVNPANNGPANYDLMGFPCRFAQDLSVSAPLLNLAVGASTMYGMVSNSASNNWAASDVAFQASKMTLSRLCSYFDICIANDVHNDNPAGYADVLYEFTRMVKAMCPGLKVYGCRVPNGYTDINGSLQAYSTGLDGRWSAQDGMVTSQYWDDMLSVREPGVNEYLTLGDQVSSTTTATGTTTTLIDSSATWLTNQWANSWVEVGGVRRLISSNTRTQLTFSAFLSVVGSGVAYKVKGNMSYDGLHPSAFGQRRLGVNLKSEILRVCPSFKFFTRTQ